MEKTFQGYLSIFPVAFEKIFSHVYKDANPARRARLLPYIPTMFRRFSCASNEDGNGITPMQVMEATARHLGEPLGVATVVRARSLRKYTGTEFTLHVYDESSHPASADLRALMQLAANGIELSEADEPRLTAVMKLAEHLSNQDPLYAAYLVSVALKMGLLTVERAKPLRAVPAPLGAPLLDMPDGALLKQIVEASIAICAERMNAVMPPGAHFFTKAFVRGMLKKPIDTDDLFQRVFGDMEHIMEAWSNDEDGPDRSKAFSPIQAALASATFFIGVALDKFFFTPFGYYLRFIYPVYTLGFDIYGDIDLFLEANEHGDQLTDYFYAPCSLYHLSPLGRRFFNVKTADEGPLNMLTSLPFPLLAGSLEELLRQEPEYPKDGAKVPMAVFRVRSLDDPALWIQLELPEESSLHRLYLILSDWFGLISDSDYSYFHDDAENPFTEYVSPKRRNRAKKAAAAKLSDLDFTHKPQLLLNARGTPVGSKNAAAKLSVTFIKKTAEPPDEEGYCVTRVSRKMQSMLDDPE